MSRFSRVLKITSINYRRDYVNRGERNVKSQSSIMWVAPRHLFKHIYSSANTIRSFFSPLSLSFFFSYFPRERFSPIFQCPLHLLSFMSSLFLSRATSINTQRRHNEPDRRAAHANCTVYTPLVQYKRENAENADRSRRQKCKFSVISFQIKVYICVSHGETDTTTEVRTFDSLA